MHLGTPRSVVLPAAAGIVLNAITLADAAPEEGEVALFGPLRVRDMTPFNLQRLDIPPVRAVTEGAGTWGFEANLTFANTFVMSGNVERYLEGRALRQPLTRADADAILALGEDAYYVDGEFGLVGTLTAAYEAGLTPSTNVIVQAFAGTSTVRGTDVEELGDDKFQMSPGLRSRRGRLTYGFAVTENLLNFENTPDIGVSLSLVWSALRT